MKRVAGLGKVVSIRYKGGIKGETPVDDRSSGEPLTVLLGDMKLPKGIEEALSGMVPGEQKVADIAPELGYGEYHEDLAQWYPRVMLDNGYSLQTGDVLFKRNPEDGRRIPAWVVESTNDQVRIDFNHPFAGKTLEYELELVDVK